MENQLVLWYNKESFAVRPRILPMSFGATIMNEGSFAQVSCIVPEGKES